MRIMKLALLVAFVAACAQAPTVQDAARDGLGKVIGQQAAATATDQATFDRLCPLFDAYLTVDGAGKKATASALSAVANEAASRTQDPAVKAVLEVVPAALTTVNSTQQKAARALLARECEAHGNRLDSNLR